MTTEGLLRARDAFSRRAWREAHAWYAQERGGGSFELADYESHGTTAHLVGDDELGRDVLSEGYREALRRGEHAWAARLAFWIGHGLFFREGVSQAAGWYARGSQILGSRNLDCVESGYLKIGSAVEALFEGGDAARALEIYNEILDVAERFDDAGLRSMASFGVGRSLLSCGQVESGMHVLDEVIVAVSLGEMPPMVIGDVYCGVLEACHEVLDLRRAREWTAALATWCDEQPDLVPYRGPCRVYRAEVMQFDGAWGDALAEAQQACDWLQSEHSPEGPGDAYYRLGEIHRLRGESAAAEEYYRRASRAGRRPEPGNALLLLAQGRSEQAEASVRRALTEETGLTAPRALLLDAALRIADSTDDEERARELAREIGNISRQLETPALRGLAARAEGLALMLRGNPDAAVGPLRRAWMEWQRLGVPYEAGCTRVLLGRAYEGLGDHNAAMMEFDAARWVFSELGALHELAQLDRIAPGEVPPMMAGPLTQREREVLRLLAEGRTNKEIGAALVISEHTVARHVQNMLTKLGFASRTALAAFAIEHGLGPTRRT